MTPPLDDGPRASALEQWQGILPGTGTATRPRCPVLIVSATTPDEGINRIAFSPQ